MSRWKKKKGLGYARISADPEDLEEGVGRQQDDNCEWIDRTGAVLVGDEAAGTAQFVDDDVSASDKSRKPRKAYLRLLAAVEEDSELEFILCWKVDRFLRRNDELEDVIKLAKRRGGLWVITSEREYDLLNADDVMMLTIIVAVSRRESAYISARTKRQRKEQRKNFELPQGSIFGWAADGQSSDPLTAPHVVEMVTRLLAGESLNDVARWLNEAKVPLRLGGSRWYGTTVKGVVLTPRHYGHYSFRDPDAMVKVNGKLVKPKRAPVVILKRDAFAPIDGLSGEMYEQVVGLLGERARTRRPARRGPFTGLLFCGQCKSVLTRGVSGTAAVWRCEKRFDLPGRCGGVNIRALPLEAWVERAVWARVDDLDLARLARRGKAAPDAGALAERLERLRARYDAGVTEAALGDDIDQDIARAKLRVIVTEMDRIKAELAKLSTSRVLRPFAGQPGSLERAWPSLTDDVRRDIISEVLSTERARIEVDRGRPNSGVVEVDYRCRIRKIRAGVRAVA